jgi:hypothetical protein
MRHLAGADEFIERLQRLLHGRVLVVAVDLQHVDALDPEALQ